MSHGWRDSGTPPYGVPGRNRSVWPVQPVQRTRRWAYVSGERVARRTVVSAVLLAAVMGALFAALVFALTR
jgi:hypothetical protein